MSPRNFMFLRALACHAYDVITERTLGDPWWNSLAGINKDDTVDMSDISFEIDNFLNRWNP